MTVGENPTVGTGIEPSTPIQPTQIDGKQDGHSDPTAWSPSSNKYLYSKWEEVFRARTE